MLRSIVIGPFEYCRSCCRPLPPTAAKRPFCARPTAMSEPTTYRIVINRLFPGDAATANQLRHPQTDSIPIAVVPDPLLQKSEYRFPQFDIQIYVPQVAQEFGYVVSRPRVYPDIIAVGTLVSQRRRGRSAGCPAPRRSRGRNAHCCVPPAQFRTWTVIHPAPTSGV